MFLSHFFHHKEQVLSSDHIRLVAAYDKDVQENYAQHALVTVEGSDFLKQPQLHQEVFGPFSMVVQCENYAALEAVILALEGQLTGTLIGNPSELQEHPTLIAALQNRVGRLIYNGVPTGVEVCPSMVHGGPYPASTDSRFTAVGVHSIKRWVRPFSYQDWPNDLLPDALKDENPLHIERLVNNTKTRKTV